QTGEGTIEIIYGSTSIPAGPQTLSGYLARPDGGGEWPTILVFGPQPLPLSSVKNICRIFARHGIAALAPDMTESHESNALIASRVAGFVTDPTGDWSNAQFGFGVLAFGSGVSDASALAIGDGRVVAIASVAATFDDQVVDDLSVAQIPALWIGSRADSSADVDVSLESKEALSQTTFVIHADAAEGFWNDGAEGFDADTATDTVDRLVAFFGAELPPRV
ncbi:MAG: dienelactone hydrolase family protein, partial [Acidimicrobiia bacterium]